MLENPKVLVPVDFTEHSDAALAYAVDVFGAGTTGAVFDLLHVVRVPRLGVPAVMLRTPHGPDLSLEDALRERARDEMRLLVEPLVNDGLDARGHVLVGEPAAEICGVARQGGHGLIVMGTHGRRGLAHLLLGSVAGRVLRTAPCPVITVSAGRVRAARAKPVAA